jgi:hypothetical protein
MPIDCLHYVPDGNLSRWLCQHISASRAFGGFDHPFVPKIMQNLGKKLFRDLFGGGDFLDTYRLAAVMTRQINKGPKGMLGGWRIYHTSDISE